MRKLKAYGNEEGKVKEKRLGMIDRLNTITRIL